MSSSDPEASRVPSGDQATELTPSEWRSRVAASSPDDGSQSLTVLSSLPEATRRPSGDQATEPTHAACLLKVCKRLPVSASQIPTLLSAEPEASRRPSGGQARLHTVFLCPRSNRGSAHVRASQTRIPPWVNPAASRAPSGDQARARHSLPSPNPFRLCSRLTPVGSLSLAAIFYVTNAAILQQLPLRAFFPAQHPAPWSGRIVLRRDRSECKPVARISVLRSAAFPTAHSIRYPNQATTATTPPPCRGYAERTSIRDSSS